MSNLEKLRQKKVVEERGYGYELIPAIGKDLQGLLGFATVLHELIQNADDAKATSFEIDICDDIFYVGNNAIFSEKNFEIISKIGSGNKRDDMETIGKFGMGFIAVYQLCDEAYVSSAGRTIQLSPSRGKTIELEFNEPQWATTFALPWVFENTKLRQGFGIRPLQKSQLNEFEGDVTLVFRKAGLFLRHLTSLKASRNGKPIYETSLEREETCLTALFENHIEEYHYFEWEISIALKTWLASHPMKRTRKEKFSILFPKENFSTFIGELFAYLPTGVKTGLPCHINADFFPTQDRKNLLWEGDDRAEWNKKLLLEIASKIPEIMESLYHNPEDIYVFLKVIQNADPQRADLNFFIEACWSNCTTEFRGGEWIYCEDQTWRNLSASLLYDKKVVEPIRNALRDFCNWHFAHKLTTPFEQLLEDLEVDKLDLETYLNGLDGVFPSLNENLPDNKVDRLEQLKPFIQHLHNYDNAKLAENHEQFLEIDFALAEDGSINNANQLYFFEKIHHDALNPWCSESLRLSVEWQNLLPNELIKLLPETDVRDFFDVLSKTTPEQMLTYYKAGWKPKQLFKLLRDNDCSWDEIEALPIFPIQGYKEFCTGNEIVRSGDFADQFNVRKTLAKDISTDFDEWLEELGVPKLEPEAYFSVLLPEFFTQDFDNEIKQKIIRFLAINFQIAKAYLSSWKNIEIAFCADRKWRLTTDVYFKNDVMDSVFSDDYCWLEEKLSQESEVYTLYKELGVQSAMKDIDIIKWLEKNKSQVVSKSNIEIRGKIIEHIKMRGENFKEFSKLLTIPWLPDNTDSPRWHPPKNLYDLSWQEHIRYSMPSGKSFCFFDIPSPLAKNLGLSNPTIEMIVQNLEIMHKRSEKISEGNLAILERNHTLLGNFIENLQKLPLIASYTSKNCFISDPKLGNYRLQYPNKYKNEYPNLTELLKIKEKPLRDDFIDVLLEIAEKFDGLPENQKKDTLNVVEDCLESLASIYRKEQEKKEPSQIWLQKIQDLKIIPHQGSLVKAITVAFRDLGEDQIKRYQLDDVERLLVKLKGDVGFYERLGVKSLKARLELEFFQTQPQSEKLHLGFIKILAEKESVLLRIILHEKKLTETKAFELYKSLKPFVLEKIFVRRTIRIHEKPFTKTLQFDFAYNKRSKQLLINQAKLELLQEALAEAFEIKDGSTTSNLEMFLKSQETVQENHAYLDRHKFSPLPEKYRPSLIPSPTLETIDIVPDPQLPPIPLLNSSHSLDGLQPRTASPSQSGQTQRPNTPIPQFPASKSRSTGTVLQEVPSDDKAHEPSAPSEIEKSLPKKPKNNQPQKRFKSYVYAEREKQENEERQESTTQQTDLRGMKLAMEYELSQGRIPSDSPSRDKGCGYDIESRSTDGTEVRLIELKTTGSIWETQGVTMTPNEFQKAMRLGDKYWLYVIEDLNGQPRLYRIQNLEDNIQSIVFDGGWKMLQS